MKRMQSAVALGSALILSLGMAVPAFAQSYITGAVNTAAQAAVDTGASINVDVGASGSASTSDSSASGSAIVPTSASASVGATITPIVVTRADVDSNAVQTSSDSAAQVQSNDDLSGYIAAQIQNDSNVSRVQTSPASVAVTYTESAKLFGVIPVSADVTATTDASGTVSVNYPWWAFLATTDKADLQTKLQTQVSNDLNVNGAVQASGQLSNAQQAQLVSDIRAVMQSELNASATASTSADVNAGSGASY